MIAGEQPQDTAECIHRADVYGEDEPRDLAGRFAPLHRSVNGDRFFFSTCKRQKGSSTRRARAAGRGVCGRRRRAGSSRTAPGPRSARPRCSASRMAARTPTG
ncbi:hypothetical protein ABZP36_009354 [Zizania latifolia]